MTERIPKGSTRCDHPGCKRPAVFNRKGGSKYKTDKKHDLCPRHWRDYQNAERSRKK